MTTIKDQYTEGERPYYASRNLRLEHVTIGEGESGLKESRGIKAESCEFEGKYVLWECEDVECRNCHFAESDRAPIWYGKNIRLQDCVIDAPKALRELYDISLERVRISNGAETFWYCRKGTLTEVRMEQGDYAFMHSQNLQISNLQLRGRYAFQYVQGIELHNAILDTKDAFWGSKDCVVYDSEIKSEYLGWYAKKLRLVRCHISGTQPLCYCENLILEDCTMAEDADLAFEYSSVEAIIKSGVRSIKNPLTGHIRCEHCGELILDEHQKAPADCKIEVRQTNL